MATATATAQRTKSDYQLAKTERDHANELRDLQFAERQRVRAEQAGGKVIDAQDRFGRRAGGGLVLAEGPSGFGTMAPDLDDVRQRSDASPIEMSGAEGGLVQLGGSTPAMSASGKTPEEPAGAESQGAASPGVVTADQNEQTAARELRAEKLKDKKEKSAGPSGIPGVLQGGEQTLENVGAIAQQLASNGQRINTFITAGSFSLGVAFVDLGIMTAACWTGMGLLSALKLPLSNRFGLPDPKPVWAIPVIFLDIIVALLLTVALMIAYYVTNPVEATWELLKSLVTHWFGVIFSK